MPTAPHLRVERAWLSEGLAAVAGADEVGRGALAGPVTAGVVVLRDARKAPEGLRDSKLLSPERREALVPEIDHDVPLIVDAPQLVPTHRCEAVPGAAPGGALRIDPSD